MVEQPSIGACPLCGASQPHTVLSEAGWASPQTISRLAQKNPRWRRADGACPACVQQALLEVLAEKGEAALHAGLQSAWPLDPEAAFGALPTPLRLHADPCFTGKGVALALIDAGFYPHPDLTQPHNRIRAWVDVRHDPVQVLTFGPEEAPRWPGSDSGDPYQWHGLMTSVTAAGNGWLSHGLYRGLASEADLILVQARDEHGQINNASIARALAWVQVNARSFNVRVVSLSLAGDDGPLAPNPVDDTVAALVGDGIVVVAAAGNDGQRRLVPPATAPQALTVGGLDDHSLFDHEAVQLWHSNYGHAVDGSHKPELVAPSIWVAAPLLPNSSLAQQARQWFGQRARGDASVEAALEQHKLITPHYQHVDGTSFAAPLVASIAAQMLEANPALRASRVRELMVAAARPIEGASLERQGAGAIEAGRAVSLAIADAAASDADRVRSPILLSDTILFRFYDRAIAQARVFGSWDAWAGLGGEFVQVRPGLWQAAIFRPKPGPYAYKFLVNGHRWLADPLNAARDADGHGGWNSVLVVEP
jgi:serine protease AprX